jgi:AbiJ N-terminal domain 4
MRFSEREGFKPARAAFQVDSVDEALRINLWNVLQVFVLNHIRLEHNYPHSDVHTFLYSLWWVHYQRPIEEQPETFELFVLYIRQSILTGPWYEIYDIIEYCLNNFRFSATHKIEDFRTACNYWLKQEMSAWRIVGNQIARLTSDEEIAAVETAQALGDKYEAVSTHIGTALKHLSDRKSPDYRNSIKEAISAVESMCRIITGDAKATLGDALKRLEKEGVMLHPAIKVAFGNLYGYTSDQGGIRHSLLDQTTTVDFDDAKFMLVSCSAFVNLLKARSA